MQEPAFFIGQDVIFSSDSLTAAVTIIGAKWNDDLDEWQYRYNVSNGQADWFHESDVTHCVPVNKEWESIESQTKSANVYAI